MTDRRRKDKGRDEPSGSLLKTATRPGLDPAAARGLELRLSPMWMKDTFQCLPKPVAKLDREQCCRRGCQHCREQFNLLSYNACPFVLLKGTEKKQTKTSHLVVHSLKQKPGARNSAISFMWVLGIQPLIPPVRN